MACCIDNLQLLQTHLPSIRTLDLPDTCKATSRVREPSLGSSPNQGLQAAGGCSNICLQGIVKELEHAQHIINYDELLGTLNIYTDTWAKKEST